MGGKNKVKGHVSHKRADKEMDQVVEQSSLEADEWQKAMDLLGELPAVGTVLCAIDPDQQYEFDPNNEEQMPIRCDKTGLNFAKREGLTEPKWGIVPSGCKGLVILFDRKNPPLYPFTAVKITGHPRSGKCIFGEVSDD